MSRAPIEQPPRDEPVESSQKAGQEYDPMRSFFDPIRDDDTVVELLSPGSRKQRELLTASSGSSLLLHLLETTGYLPQIPTITPRSELKDVDDPAATQQQESDQQRAVLMKRKPIVDVIRSATEEYRETYWLDYATGQGFDVDKLDELFAQTEELAEQSDIHKIISALRIEKPHLTNLIEAQRIVRLLLQRERQHSTEQSGAQRVAM